MGMAHLEQEARLPFVSKPRNPISSTRSPVGPHVEKCPPIEFAKAMAHLVSLKRTAALTDLQMTAWHNVLGVFDTDIVNAAVLQIAVTDSRWPEVGDLYQLCRKLAIKQGRLKPAYVSGGTGSDKEAGIPTMIEIREIAARFGLRVPN